MNTTLTRLLVGAVVAASVAVPATAAIAAVERGSTAPSIEFSPCPDGSGLECGTIEVPVDHDDPDGDILEIAVARAPAFEQGQRKGVLIYNPGGPGQSAILLMPIFLTFLPLEITDFFDIIAVDERGTGADGRIDCGTSAADSVSPPAVPEKSGDPIPGADVFEAMAQSCTDAYGPTLGQINTTNAAKDMDLVREALGEDTISFYGLSYGTLLGATYAQLFPDRVRAMVLDGAIDPQAPLLKAAREEAKAMERALEDYFASCEADRECELGSDPRGFYEEVKDALEDEPLPAPGGGDNVPVTVGDLHTATLFFLSVPAFAGSYPAALQAAADGDGAPLRQLASQFFQDLDGASLVDAFWALTCEDQAVHPNAVQAGKLATQLDRRYPLVGAHAVNYLLGGCTAWPNATVPVPDINDAGSSPVLVIGNTGDPNTPHLWATRLVRSFDDGRLVTNRSPGHTWIYNVERDDGCVSGIVTDYLIELDAPKHNTSCG